MKTIAFKFLLCCLLLLIALPSMGALTPVQSQVKNYVDHTPKAVKTDLEQLGDYLGKISQDEYTRALTVYTWVAQNIRYDWESYRSKQYADQRAIAVLARGSAVCCGYAALFQALCRIVGLECEVVTGYAKGYSFEVGQSFEKTNHAWNAVKIYGKWELMDVTWGAPDEAKEAIDFYYFCAVPRYFLNDHLPVAAAWQRVPKAISLHGYENTPLISKNFHLLGFENVTPRQSTLPSDGSLQSIFLMQTLSMDIKYLLTITDNAGAEQDLPYVQRFHATGIALNFTIPAGFQGKLTIWADSENSAYHQLLEYAVRAPLIAAGT